MSQTIQKQIAQLQAAVIAQEGLRTVLGDATVDATIAVLNKQLAELQTQVALTEQRKQVTVLFADVSGFTAMSETLDAEVVKEIMNTLWHRLDQAITDYGGWIDKHIGDAVMALWGVEHAHENDPEQAVRAALAMQQAIKEWEIEDEQLGNSISPDSSMPQISIRIGLNTGPVLLGEVGSIHEFTALGDTVNLASRLEHAAPVGGILISHATYRHIRGIFDVLPQPLLSVKGKVAPVKTYVVQRAKPRAFHLDTRGVEGIETRMVGRDAELRHLQDAHHTLFEDAEMQVVTVVGEAGLGKSRLLYEFQQWAELQPEDFRFFQARASQQMQSLPHFLIRDLFAFRFQIAESDPPEVVRRKFETGIVEFMGEGSEQKAHFIGYLVGYPFSNSPYLRGILDDPRQIYSIALHYLVQFFTAVTSLPDGMPAHILLEDIHWADDGSLDVIQHLIQYCQNLPILIVCLARPLLFERRPLWGEGQLNHTRLDLHPLSKRDSRRLVVEILQRVHDVPPKLRNLIVSNTEGNPFYVEELIKVLLDDGVIVKEEAIEGERWRVVLSELAGIQIPPTLQGVLQARLDALPEMEREVLKRAAVVGRVFWDRAVLCLCQDISGDEISLAQLNDLLVELRTKEFIFSRERSSFAEAQEHIFKHALLWEATYEMVLLRQRRRYHAQMTNWLIEQGGERVGEYAGLIADHYEKARQIEQSAIWYGRAGKEAQDAYAPEEAIAYYKKSLALIDTSDVRSSESATQLDIQRLRLYEGLGEMLKMRSRYAEAIEAYTAMHTTAERLGDVPALARAWLGLSDIQDDQGDNRSALFSAEQAIAIARQTSAAAQPELASALCGKGWSIYRLGEMEKALNVAEEAYALSTKIAHPAILMRSLNLLGSIYHLMGAYEPAITHMAQSLAIAQELGNREWEAKMLNNLAESHRGIGDYTQAVHLYQAAIPIAREIGSLRSELLYRSNLGLARVALGEYAAVETDLPQVIEQIEDEEWWFLPAIHIALAEAYLGQGRFAAAQDAIRQALPLAQASENPEFLGYIWRVLGKMLGIAEDRNVCSTKDTLSEVVKMRNEVGRGTADCFAESIRVYAESAMEVEQAITLQAWGVYELTRGDVAQGESLWQEARVIFERLNLPLMIERMDREREHLAHVHMVGKLKI